MLHSLRQLVPSIVITISFFTSILAAAPPQSLDSEEFAYGSLPIAFEPNVGQTANEVRYLARGAHWTAFLTSNEAVLRFPDQERLGEVKDLFLSRGRESSGTVLRFSFEGGNAKRVTGATELGSKANYFESNDRARWKSGVSQYGAVQYESLYEGIDVVFYGNRESLEHDFIIAPGANPNQIRIKIDGAEAIHVNARGDLVMTSGGREFRLLAPVAYQEVDGMREGVVASYTVNDEQLVAFVTGSYDRNRELVIDPILSYSTFLGGSFSTAGHRIVVDSAGSAYVAGLTQDVTFPTTDGAYREECLQINGVCSQYLFVSKLNPEGTAQVYSTFLGAVAGLNFPLFGLAVDGSGNAYLTGMTADGDYPVTTGQTSCGGWLCNNVAFLTKLNASGSALVYSLYFGGSPHSSVAGVAIAVDVNDQPYVAGVTVGDERIPITFGVVQPSCAYSPDDRCAGVDGFVAKFSSDGMNLIYSTFLGGGQSGSWPTGLGADYPTGIAVDGLGNAYVTGITYASDFPTTEGAFLETAPEKEPWCAETGCPDGFITKLNPTATAFIYSTYLGGSNADRSSGIAVDSAGNAYVAGTTQGGSCLLMCAFVSKFSPTGLASYSVVLDGNGSDQGMSIAVNDAGNAYVTGVTQSTNFPVTPNATKSDCSSPCGGDVFITKLSPSGALQEYSSYVGQGVGYDVALDNKNNIYITGQTVSASFPVTPGAFDTVPGGSLDGFVTKIIEEPNAPVDLSATAISASQINLAWTDHSLNENAFRIEQSTDGMNFLEIASVDENTTSHAALNLLPNTTYYFRVRASNDAGYSAYSNTAAATTDPLPQAPTATAVNNAIATYSASAQNIALSATVSSTMPVNEGTVSFRIHDDGSTIGSVFISAPLTNGIANVTYSLPAGSTAKIYSIDATYSGGFQFLASTGIGMLTVGPAPTSTIITSSVNPSSLGQSVTFSATVVSSRGAPTGTVDFKDGAALLGAVGLAGGRAFLTVSSLDVGEHSITATYNPSINFTASASDELIQAVRPVATAGTLDTDFGTFGTVTTAFTGNARINAVAIQSDGKILAAGLPTDLAGIVDFALARYTTDGTLDATFGMAGKVTTDFFGRDDAAFAVTVQPDGKILVAGWTVDASSDFAVARYDADGTLDPTFGTGGKVTTDFFGRSDVGRAIALQSDGKVIVAGYAGMDDLGSLSLDMAVVRYNTNGSLDTTFSLDGRANVNLGSANEEARALFMQPDGKLVIAGLATGPGGSIDFALVRLNVDGSLDAGFGQAGSVTTDFAGFNDFANGLVLQPDGKVVAGGFASNSDGSRTVALARYNTDGTIDTGFGMSGRVTTGFGNISQANSLGIEPSGKIVVAGFTFGGDNSPFDFVVARYNTNGSIDSTFGVAGKTTTDFYGGVDVANAVAIADGKIVAGGSAIRNVGNSTVSDFALARYFGTPAPIVVQPPPDITAVEGAVVSLHPVTFSDVDPAETHIATVDWGDGTIVPGIIVESAGSGTVQATHTYADNGVYTVQVRVANTAGASVVKSFSATVSNSSPSIDLSSMPNQDVVLGAALNLSIVFFDSGFDNAVAMTSETFTATIDWEDGNIESPSNIPPAIVQGGPALLTQGTIQSSYIYSSIGTYAVNVCVTDDDGGHDCKSGLARVVDPGSGGPDTTITSGPAAATNSLAASFSFTSSVPGSTFQCRLDTAPFATCTSPRNFTGLSVGMHTFEVRATDPANNTDPTPASFTWNIDRTAPDSTITSNPVSPTNIIVASFEFVANEPGSTFECRLDGAAFAACSSPRAYTALAAGSHTFRVRATDAAGNVDGSPAVFTWVIDITAPNTNITANPPAASSSADATFSFTASQAGSTMACSLDNGAFTPCTSPLTYSTLADGSHNFQVRATDAAGNTDTTPDAFTWTIDTVIPDTSITGVPPSLSNSGGASFTFSSNEAGARFQCSLDSAAFANCSSPRNYSGLGDGAHTFHVRSRDVAGNVDATPATYSWVVDRTAPDTTITSNPPSVTNITSATFTFISNDPAATFLCSLDGATFAPCMSPVGFASLSTGNHTFRVRAIDPAGNSDGSPAAFTWNVDTTAPNTNITGNPTAVTTSTTATFTFTASQAGSSFACGLDSEAFTPCTSPLTYTGLSSGVHNFRVQATDPAGNTDPTPASFNWRIQ